MPLECLQEFAWPEHEADILRCASHYRGHSFHFLNDSDDSVHFAPQLRSSVRSSFNSFLVGQPSFKVQRDEPLDGRFDDVDPRRDHRFDNDDMPSQSNHEEVAPNGALRSSEVDGTARDRLLEYWSIQGTDGEGAQLLTDGTGQVLAKSVHHNSHHAKLSNTAVASAHSHAGHSGQPPAHHDSHQDEKHDNADMGNSDNYEDNGAIPTLIINDEANTFQPIAMVGGLTAILAQAYLWGNVFTTLFKSQRTEVHVSAVTPRQELQTRMRAEQVQSAAPTTVSPPISFSGASGRPGATWSLPSQSATSNASDGNL